jgi:hypothetical protein
MQRLINAIDKATRAGAYTLEETAQILQAIDQVGAIVSDYNQKQEAIKESMENSAKQPVMPPTPVGDMEVVGAEVVNKK